jgi:hypothetical protein
MASRNIERKLAAIVAADIAGYSRLMGADEVGTLQALKALTDPVGHHSVEAFNRWQTQEISTLGPCPASPCAESKETCLIVPRSAVSVPISSLRNAIRAANMPAMVELTYRRRPRGI